jgi:biopolymer transport protein ExbD
MRLQPVRGEDEPEISLVSLIDVIFCVIIFLVVTTTFDVRSALKLELPKADAALQPTDDAPLLLVVSADGRYYLGQSEVVKRDVAGLLAALETVGPADAERRVVLRADAHAQHQAVVTAYEALGKAGYRRISLATAPVEAGSDD